MSDIPVGEPKTCMTCRYRYESDDFGPLVSLCLIYNGCGGRDLGLAVGTHIRSERARLGTLRTFDDVTNCPSYGAGKPIYDWKGGFSEWY